MAQELLVLYQKAQDSQVLLPMYWYQIMVGYGTVQTSLHLKQIILRYCFIHENIHVHVCMCIYVSYRQQYNIHVVLQLVLSFDIIFWRFFHFQSLKFMLILLYYLYNISWYEHTIISQCHIFNTLLLQMISQRIDIHVPSFISLHTSTCITVECTFGCGVFN